MATRTRLVRTARPRVLMDARAIRQAVSRLARAIVRRHPQGDEVVLVGIQTGGVQLARSMATVLRGAWKRTVEVGQLDITLHRDDLHQRLAPHMHPTTLPADVTGKTVILVDDVVFSGRTIRAALDAMTDLGRPQRIQLAVLIDRGHRELPIHPDFVGRTFPTAPGDRVDVQLADGEGLAKVLLEKASAR